MSNNPYEWLQESLDTIQRAHWHRTVQEIQGKPGAEVYVNGTLVINFASNDYLGLAGDERLQQAVKTTVDSWGVGSTGSRLLSGHRQLHEELERALSRYKGTEDALVFSSGYLANLGVISAVVGSRDLILADQYNHSSLKNGALLSGAKIITYEHSNTQKLRTDLQEYRPQYRRCLIITDGVFSMDGDICNLPELLNISDEFQTMLLVDDAHGTGVLGSMGGGVVDYWNCRNRELIQTGTLSKALGSLGGYVAGTKPLIEFLRNRASTWIYSTGLSLPDTAAALQALHIVNNEPQRRQQLWQNVELLQEHLKSLSLEIIPSYSAIICIKIKDASTALKLSGALRDLGVFAAAIRPPTVPTSRLRISLMSTHTPAHLETLLKALACFS